MVYKLAQHAHCRWRKLDGHELIPDVISGRPFINGIIETPHRDGARPPSTVPHPQLPFISPGPTPPTTGAHTAPSRRFDQGDVQHPVSASRRVPAHNEKTVLSVLSGRVMTPS